MYTTIDVDRKHLPANYLADNYFPLLVAQDYTSTAVVVPKECWDQDEIAYWNAADTAIRVPFGTI